eukprot:822303-Heterocapsa_arctica.AAC.1
MNRNTGEHMLILYTSRQGEHRPHVGNMKKSLNTFILAQNRTGTKGATHGRGKDSRSSNGGFHPSGCKSDRTSKSGSGAGKCGVQHSRNG